MPRGKVHRIVQYDRDGNVIQTYPTISAARQATGIQSTGIMRCCDKTQGSAGGYLWSYEGDTPDMTMTRRKIQKYNFFGELVEDFNTVKEIIDKYPDVNRSIMHLVLTGNKLFVKDHFWVYADESYKIPEMMKDYGRQVIAKSLDKKNTYRYISVKEAAEVLNLDRTLITRALRDKGTCNGLAWFRLRDTEGLQAFEDEVMTFRAFAKREPFQVTFKKDGSVEVFNTVNAAAKALNERPHTVYIWVHDGPSIKENTEYEFVLLDK